MTKKLPSLAAFLSLCVAIAAFGVIFKPGDWYLTLAKPVWTPPSWLFPPVWTVLYAMIGVAGWLAWQQREAIGRGWAFSVFGAQLVLNGLWSWLFFGLHRIDLAVIDISVLWVAILANAMLFYRWAPTAGLLLVPYLAWVGYAAALNFAIWRLNGG